MARLRFSFSEERLECEADWPPTVSVLGPRALKMTNIKVLSQCRVDCNTDLISCFFIILEAEYTTNQR